MIMEIVFAITWIVLVVSFLSFLAYLVDIRRQKSFNQRFPRISDEEFMARCLPGTNREIALKVRRIVAEQTGVEYERIYPESSFVNDLNAG